MFVQEALRQKRGTIGLMGRVRCHLYEALRKRQKMNMMEYQNKSRVGAAKPTLVAKIPAVEKQNVA